MHEGDRRTGKENCHIIGYTLTPVLDS